MEVKINLNGRKRKDLAKVLGEMLNEKAVYKKAPSYAYDIGGVVLDRNNILTFSDGISVEFVHSLLDSLQEKGFSVSEKPDKLAILIPLKDFDAVAQDNLQKLIASKATLIQKALGVDDLSVVQNENAISFPWFPFDTPSEDVSAYTQFVTALCDMAKKQKRVLATERMVENEKYAFRCFLLRLGFIGEEYTATRRVLLRNLTGNGSFKSGERKSPTQVEETAPEEEPMEESEPKDEAKPPSKSRFSLRGLINSITAVR